MRILLMAGGGGTRLWPLSTEDCPKQFLKLLSDKSLLRETYERVRPATEEISVATSAKHVARVRQELPEIAPERIFPEPSRRNSGPPILAAALDFAADGDPVTACVPTDQTVADAEAFRRALAAAAVAADRGPVAIFAVPPARPDTDFGYLELTEPGAAEGVEVLRFVEKPAPSEAEEYVRAGYYWNAGIFVFRPSRLLAEARRVAAELVAAVEAYRERRDAGDSAGAAAAWEALPDISFDFAIMEKATGVRAVPLRAGWSDVGTWRAVREMREPSDESGNLILSDVPVLAIGVRDSAIVVAPEGVLVLPFGEERELKAAVERLRRGEKGRPSLEDSASRRRDRR